MGLSVTISRQSAQLAQKAASRILKADPNPTPPKVTNNDALETTLGPTMLISQRHVHTSLSCRSTRAAVSSGWLQLRQDVTGVAHGPPRPSTPTWTRANLDHLATPRLPVVLDALPFPKRQCVLVSLLGRSGSLHGMRFTTLSLEYVHVLTHLVFPQVSQLFSMWHVRHAREDCCPGDIVERTHSVH